MFRWGCQAYCPSAVNAYAALSWVYVRCSWMWYQTHNADELLFGVQDPKATGEGDMKVEEADA